MKETSYQGLENFSVSTEGIFKMPLRSVPTQSSHEYAILFSTAHLHKPQWKDIYGVCNSKFAKRKNQREKRKKGRWDLEIIPESLSFLSLRCSGSSSSCSRASETTKNPRPLFLILLYFIYILSVKFPPGWPLHPILSSPLLKPWPSPTSSPIFRQHKPSGPIFIYYNN